MVCVICQQLDCICTRWVDVDMPEYPKAKQAMPSVLPCLHRGEFYGLEACDCNRAAQIYECNRFDLLCTDGRIKGDANALPVRTTAGREIHCVKECGKCGDRITN